MNIETRLTEELDTVARALPTPPPPAITDLVAQAQRETRHTLRAVVTISGLVAAVLLGVVLITQLGKPSTAPPPTKHPTGGPTTLQVGAPLRTWTDRHSKLILDDITQAGGPWAGAVTVGDLTTAQLGPYDTGATGVFLGTRRVGMLDDVLVHEIKVSPDDRTIAWVAFDDPSRKKASIAVARVGLDGIHELGRLHVAALTDAADDEGKEQLIDVTDNGTVRYGGVVGGHAWKPGTEPKPADISDFSYRPVGFPHTDDALDIQINQSGWGAWDTDEIPGEPGSEVTFRSVTIQHRGEPSTRFTFRFGDRYAYVEFDHWETPTDAILFGSTTPVGTLGPTQHLRCDVVRHTCQIAPEPKAG